MQLTKNLSRLISGGVLIAVGVLQLTNTVGFALWQVVLMLGVLIILDAQSR